jgi:hypothetical protein
MIFCVLVVVSGVLSGLYFSSHRGHKPTCIAFAVALAEQGW